MVKQEGVRYVILCVALQIEYDSELVVNLVLISHLLKPGCDLLPELWEPDGGHENPRAHSGASFDNSDWILFLVVGYLLIWVVKLLPQRVLDIVQLGDRGMDIRADVSVFQIACGHRLKSLISLLLRLHAGGSLIQQILFDDRISSDVDASPLLKNNLV